MVSAELNRLRDEVNEYTCSRQDQLEALSAASQQQNEAMAWLEKLGRECYSMNQSQSAQLYDMSRACGTTASEVRSIKEGADEQCKQLQQEINATHAYVGEELDSVYNYFESQKVIMQSATANSILNMGNLVDDACNELRAEISARQSYTRQRTQSRQHREVTAETHRTRERTPDNITGGGNSSFEVETEYHATASASKSPRYVAARAASPIRAGSTSTLPTSSAPLQFEETAAHLAREAEIEEAPQQSRTGIIPSTEGLASLSTVVEEDMAVPESVATASIGAEASASSIHIHGFNLLDEFVAAAESDPSATSTTVNARVSAQGLSGVPAAGTAHAGPPVDAFTFEIESVRTQVEASQLSVREKAKLFEAQRAQPDPSGDSARAASNSKATAARPTASKDRAGILLQESGHAVGLTAELETDDLLASLGSVFDTLEEEGLGGELPSTDPEEGLLDLDAFTDFSDLEALLT